MPFQGNYGGKVARQLLDQDLKPVRREVYVYEFQDWLR